MPTGQPGPRTHYPVGTTASTMRRVVMVMDSLNPHHLDPADPHNLQGTEAPVLERIEIATEGEDCDECVRKLRQPLMKISGVDDVRVETDTERVVVTFDARRTNAPDIHDAILRSGYKAAPLAD